MAARSLAFKVNDWSDDSARDLMFLARHPDLVSMDPARQRAFLLQVRDAYPWYSYLHTIGPDGINLARSDSKSPIDYRDRAYFRYVMAGAPYAREMLLQSRGTGRPALNQAAPINAPDGNVAGVLVAGMDLDTLSEAVGAARTGATGYSCLIDERGGVLAQPWCVSLARLQHLSDGRLRPEFLRARGDSVGA